MAPSALLGVRETPLTVSQDALLHSLERQLQLKMQKDRHASLLRSERRSADAAETLRDFLASRQTECKELAPVQMDPSFQQLSAKMDTCSAQWDALYAHAHASQALVAEMEASHVQVAAKTQALYRSFEDVLQQVEALDARVAAVAAPMPHFTAIDGVARSLGFGVKFAAPSGGSGAGHVLMERTGGRASNAAAFSAPTDAGKAVPTTPSFEQALDKIDQSVAYLTQHVGSTCPVLEARWWVLTDL